MLFFLVTLALAISLKPLLPEQALTSLEALPPYALDFALIAVLLMMLVRIAQLSNLAKTNASLQASLKDARNRTTKLEESQAQVNQARDAALQEKDKFAGAFRASQAQVDRLQAELKEAEKSRATESSAITLLGLLQKKGRFLDFIMADAAGIPDEAFAAAARVVHQGCADVVKSHFELAPVAGEEEGGLVTLGTDYDTASYQLTGKVADEGPYEGRLVHRGWQAKSFELPVPSASAGAAIFQQAEVELH